jgi:hypothetical protein
MGLCVAVQTESGKQIKAVADEKNLLSRMLDSPDGSAFPMLASIDKYGDTVFNRVQMDRFLAEWKTLYGAANTAEETSLLKAVQDLAEESMRGVHRYLVFIGD